MLTKKRTRGVVAIGLLGFCMSAGCNVVLPNQSPSQLWPMYIRQQAEFAYSDSCRRGTVCRIPTPGQPASDYRQGFLEGYQQQATCQLGTEPGPCYPRGWGWVARPSATPPTPSYFQGQADGTEAALARHASKPATTNTSGAGH